MNRCTSRRAFLKSTAVGLGALACGRTPGRAAAARRPNIIFLLTDDHRWDALGCAGNRIVRTPNIDAMAADGVRFTNAFVTTSICATSRASIFSGQYARRHGIHDFATPFSDAAWADTYPARLKAAGYRLGLVAKYQEMVKGYYRLITGVDVVVGRIRDELDRLGLADNTVILFMGDNGFFLGEHGLAGKWYGYEESIRVPLVVYDPRLPAVCRGRTPAQIALNIDVAPTILSLADCEVPPAMQGADLSPVMRGRKGLARSDFFYEHLFAHRPAGGGANLIPQTEGVVSLRYKYLRYIEQDPAYEQLFDLRMDPHESRNLAGEPDRHGLLQAMRARWGQFKEQCH